VLVALAMLTVTAGCGSSWAEPGIYVSRLDGGAPGWIGAPVGAPVWSPVGDSIAWGTEDGLFVHDLATGATRVLSDQAIAGRPAWEPNGDSIAVASRDAMSVDAIDLTSGTSRFSISTEFRDSPHAQTAMVTAGAPAWAPDGEWIAFSCWDGHGDEICIADGDGGNRRQLTDIAAAGNPSQPVASARAIANAGRPSWSPDGEFLAIAIYPERRGAPTGLFIIDPEAGEVRKISGAVPVSEIGWGRQSDWVVFAAIENGRSDVYRVSIVSGTEENLTETLPAAAQSPSLSPDGSRVAVTSDGEIVMIDITNGGTSSIESPLWGRFPAWSPNADVIAFAAEANEIRRYDPPQ
jgi:Tol biopolymer transport system component